MDVLRRLEELIQKKHRETKPKKCLDINNIKQVSEIIGYPPHQDWTFKALIDQKKEYLKTVCDHAFSRERTLTKKQFLDQFVREISNENPDYFFAQELNRYPEKIIFENVIMITLSHHAIEKDDLYRLVGAYVLHLAQKEKLVKLKKDIVIYSPLN